MTTSTSSTSGFAVRERSDRTPELLIDSEPVPDAAIVELDAGSLARQLANAYRQGHAVGVKAGAKVVRLEPTGAMKRTVQRNELGQITALIDEPV